MLDFLLCFYIITGFAFKEVYMQILSRELSLRETAGIALVIIGGIILAINYLILPHVPATNPLAHQTTRIFILLMLIGCSIILIPARKIQIILMTYFEICLALLSISVLFLFQSFLALFLIFIIIFRSRLITAWVCLKLLQCQPYTKEEEPIRSKISHTVYVLMLFLLFD